MHAEEPRGKQVNNTIKLRTYNFTAVALWSADIAMMGISFSLIVQLHKL